MVPAISDRALVRALRDAGSCSTNGPLRNVDVPQPEPVDALLGYTSGSGGCLKQENWWTKRLLEYAFVTLFAAVTCMAGTLFSGSKKIDSQYEISINAQKNIPYTKLEQS
jgi:hypothetical protein